MEVQADIIPIVGHILTQMTLKNDKIPLHPSQVTIFHSRTPPPISVQEYLQRIVRFSVCSNYCFVVALIYIDRIAEKEMLISTKNIHRLLITSLVLASKMYDDDFYQNKYYAQVGGLDVQELNELEVQFLKMLNFKLTVSSDAFDKYNFQLSKHAKNSAQPQQAGSAPQSASVAQKINTAIALNHHLENQQVASQQPTPTPKPQPQAIPRPVPQAQPIQTAPVSRQNIPLPLVYAQYAQQYNPQYAHDIHQQGFYRPMGEQAYAYSYPLMPYQQYADEEMLVSSSACEELIMNEIKYKRFTPRVIQEERPISPASVMRACAHVENLRFGFSSSPAVGVYNRGY